MGTVALKLGLNEIGDLLKLPDECVVEEVINSYSERMKRMILVMINGPDLPEHCRHCEVPHCNQERLYELTGQTMTRMVNESIRIDYCEGLKAVIYRGERSMEVDFPIDSMQLARIIEFVTDLE